MLGASVSNVGTIVSCVWSTGGAGVAGLSVAISAGSSGCDMLGAMGSSSGS